MNKGKLIILNGPSSCGKTSTCRVLQDLFTEQFVLLGVDVFCQATPPKQNNLQTIEPGYFSATEYFKDGLKYLQVTTGPLLDRVIITSFKSMAVFLENGINVIADELFWTPYWFRAALDAFAPYNVFFVGLFVSEQEGSRREKYRGPADRQDVLADNRPVGLNRTSAIITHKNMIYDFSIDNSQLSVAQTAHLIKEAYDKTPHPTAFKTLYKTFKVD